MAKKRSNIVWKVPIEEIKENISSVRHMTWPVEEIPREWDSNVFTPGQMFISKFTLHQNSQRPDESTSEFPYLDSNAYNVIKKIPKHSLFMYVSTVHVLERNNGNIINVIRYVFFCDGCRYMIPLTINKRKMQYHIEPINFQDFQLYNTLIHSLFCWTSGLRFVALLCEIIRVYNVQI